MQSDFGYTDGLYINISPEGYNAELYRLQKGYYAISVMAICNHNLSLGISFVCGQRVCMIAVYDSIRVCLQSEGNYNRHLFGDCYPCRNYLTSPLLTPTIEKEHRHI